MSKKAKTAITPTREDDFPEWYQQVIRAADMAENSPVRGCMIIKPYGYAVWENIQRIFDDMIKALGVENAYFPLLIPMEFMNREAEHVDGFAKECAVVTHHRLEKGENGLVPSESAKLEEPYIIRPTSETIIGDSMSRWVQSYRHLPMKLNQWCNVMRWEMRTRMFLRTSEFLWQEGHNAFEDAQGGIEDHEKMLDAYADLVENYMAIPVIRGKKTPDETFPGAVSTLTIEAMMQDGKALQSATSHYMGENFARSMGIKYQNREGSESYAHTTSWGLSTRTIGAMIMVHGDDDGMIMPPRIAPHPVGIIPIIRDDQDEGSILAYCHDLVQKLKAMEIRAFLDDSSARTPDKMWGMIKKGVPVRVEIGAREVAENTLTHVRRDLGRDSKETCGIDEFVGKITQIMDDIHNTLYKRAEDFMQANTTRVNDLHALENHFKEAGRGFVVMPASLLDNPDLERIKKDHSLTARCMPLDAPDSVIIGKAY
ncbi:MAG: proline--tRNA ligase [Alphaproteobacteria bacterium]